MTVPNSESMSKVSIMVTTTAKLSLLGSLSVGAELFSHFSIAVEFA